MLQMSKIFARVSLLRDTFVRRRVSHAHGIAAIHTENNDDAIDTDDLPSHSSSSMEKLLGLRRGKFRPRDDTIDLTLAIERRYRTQREMRREKVLDIMRRDGGKMDISEDDDTYNRNESFSGRALTPEVKKMIITLVNAGVDPGSITALIFGSTLENVSLKVEFLQQFCIKASMRSVFKFSRLIASSLNMLHKHGHMDEPQVAIVNIINKLPVTEEEKQYLLNCEALQGDLVSHYTVQYLGHQIVNAHCSNKLKNKFDKSLDFFEVKKFRRLHDSIRLIDILSTPEICSQIDSFAVKFPSLITFANPDTIQFFLDNPQFRFDMPLKKLITGANTSLLSCTPQEIMAKMDILFNKLGFSQQSVDNVELFRLTEKQIISRSEYWFKRLGKELVVSTPRSTKLISRFRFHKMRYASMETDDSTEQAQEGVHVIKSLLGQDRRRACSYKPLLSALYTKYGWNFEKVYKRSVPSVVRETLGIDAYNLSFDDADEIAHYLINEIKLRPEQVSEAPIIFGLGLNTVKDIIEKYKSKIDLPEWKYHPLILDFILYSHFNSRSEVSRTFEDDCIDTQALR